MKAPVAGFEPAYHCFKGSWLTVSQHPSVTVGLLFSNFKLHSSNFFLAPAAGIEPATKRLTVALPYQHRTHRNVSGGRRTRTIDLQGMNLASYQLLHPAKRPARIELASSAWQADGLPLHHGRLLICSIVKDRSRGFATRERAPSENRTHIPSL